jgi:hypothetical protein
MAVVVNDVVGDRVAAFEDNGGGGDTDTIMHERQRQIIL